MNVIRKPANADVTHGPLPASEKIYIEGERLGDIKVPMRNIHVHESANEAPLTVYDTSGIYTDPNAEIDIDAGLPRIREGWIDQRGDTELYEGREIKPEDNGNIGDDKLVPEFPLKNQPRRAKEGVFSSRKWRMPSRASLHRRWNTSRSAKTCCVRRRRRGRQAEGRGRALGR